ncbi:right-handed parallel beta-helix repeat-containing protein [Chitinophaga sancti]|uniref:Right handed beta helix region n=1 Tax=Chitinophaga sancti TaxID=1004 RepID=A0A1K1M2S7_9BACT|nr:right-handed parallel beta-helix repeat-containing protein [Chitinophaga sancti]WQD64678.1 right-handed parallel beta-helix repeat-containing protein [Chitinophaga sancti]WQG89700.1 right-handed parallel beta-helix repeat-containing protein [Chitinophaga sancti]SFW17408.1 Right handed beta helix region [Chitinophaga sancti]
MECPTLRCLLLTTTLCAVMHSLHAGNIYVSPNGDDHNNGTAAQPKATLQAALQQAREWRRLHDPALQQGIHIILKGGTYYLYEPIFIRPEDAGTPDSPTIIEAAPDERPVLSGAIKIEEWKPFKGKIRVAGIPFVVDDFRELWVDGERAVRAKDTKGDSMHRILRWDYKTESCWIPTPVVKATDGLEMFIHQWWAIAVLRIKSMQVAGDSTQLFFYQPESKIQSSHPWPAPWESKEFGNSAYWLTNALSLLDEPGEWFFDKKTKQLYYWPRNNEKSAAVPVLETLVNMVGTSYVSFKGISFQHTTWLRPSQKGHVPLQAGMYLLDAYKLETPGTPDKKGLENQAWIGRQPAAVQLRHTDHVRFDHCRFEHMAATGLDLVEGCHHDTIIGSLFKDIGGTGIQLGTFSDEWMEAHLPYQKPVCSQILVSNNLITDVTNEDWGTLGISAGFVKEVSILHNEVNEVSYTGIAVGWGWTPTVNAMSNNRIIGNSVHHYARHLYDVAGIYTLSAQPGTLITANVVDSIYKAPYAHIPKHWFYMYADEGTAYITVKDNWLPADKILQNANGPGNTWENNGPQVSDSIKQHAGLEPAYHYLIADRAPIHTEQPINH